jgi:molybdopterin converting factor small subunit
VNIEIRLFATLRKHLPAGSSRTSVRLDLPGGASIADALGELGIPVAAVHLVLINGIYEADKERALDDGCVLSVWPPIAGG